MRRANRPLALALLLIAVVCSPAGVCLIDGVAAAGPASPASHAHACCASARRTVIVASETSCCSMPRAGFVNVARFTVAHDAPTVSLGFALAASIPSRSAAFPAVTIRPPLVLRI